MTVFFALAYLVPGLGLSCHLSALAALRREAPHGTEPRRACPSAAAHAALSLGLGTTLIWASLAASDGLQASSIGLGVVAYFLPSVPAAFGVFAVAAAAAAPGVRLCMAPRGRAPATLPWPWAALLALGVALLLAPFGLGKRALEWDATRLPPAALP